MHYEAPPVDLSGARLSAFRENDDFWTNAAAKLLDDYIKIVGISNINDVTGEDLAALQNTMTWCNGDRKTQSGIIASFDARKSQFIERARIRHDWMAQAYPLKQLFVKIQGTRNSDKNSLITQLEAVVTRLKAGEESGLLHDDDCGFAFDYLEKSIYLSFFAEASGSSKAWP